MFCEDSLTFLYSSYVFQIQTPFNYLLMNLVLTELITASYGLPIDFIATYSYGWKLGKPLCEATGFILTATGKKCVILIFYSLISNVNYLGCQA